MQARFPLFKIGALGGYAERAPHPNFNGPDLLDNSYQPALEKYVEDRIGFRELLIRLMAALPHVERWEVGMLFGENLSLPRAASITLAAATASAGAIIGSSFNPFFTSGFSA